MLTILFDGIAYGMLLFVLACGLAVTLGLMNFVNLAHGAFAMAGGYVTVDPDEPLWRAVPRGAAARLPVPAVDRRSCWSARSTCTLYARSHLDQVLFTIGLVFMAVAAVDYMMGSQQQFMIQLPAWLQGRVRCLGVRHRASTGCFIIVVCGVLAVVLQLDPDAHPLRQPAARRGRRSARRPRARHQCRA